MERKTIFFNAKVEPIKPVNEEFTLCKAYVCALGKNRNFSYIGEDAAEDALETLYNCPVIGHLYEDEDGNYRMGGHDMVVEKDKDDKYYFKSLCVPYGVIPQQDNVHYEEIEEPDGRGKKTYVVADVILWTGRYPELKEAIYDDKCWFGQSMEIGIKEHAPLEEDANYTNLTKYFYSALCLLGKSDDPDYHVEPCFPESKVEPYEFALNDAEFTKMMAQLKNELASCFANIEKGGKGMNEDKPVVTEDVVASTDVTEDAVETSNATETEAEFSNEPEVTQQPEVEPAKEGGEENFQEDHTDAVEQPKKFSATYSEKRTAIIKALPGAYEEDENGNIVKWVQYYLCDFDETYAYVDREAYSPDTSELKEEKGRLAYTFDEANKTATVSDSMELMYVKWLTEDELKQIEKERANYEELVEYKKARMEEDHKNAIDEAIKEFSDLEGNEEFAKIVEKKYSYESVDAFKNACYIVRGKFAANTKHVKPAQIITVPVGTDNSDKDRDIYEEFFAAYGKKR